MSWGENLQGFWKAWGLSESLLVDKKKHSSEALDSFHKSLWINFLHVLSKSSFCGDYIYIHTYIQYILIYIYIFEKNTSWEHQRWHFPLARMMLVEVTPHDFPLKYREGSRGFSIQWVGRLLVGEVTQCHVSTPSRKYKGPHNQPLTRRSFLGDAWHGVRLDSHDPIVNEIFHPSKPYVPSAQLFGANLPRNKSILRSCWEINMCFKYQISLNKKLQFFLKRVGLLSHFNRGVAGMNEGGGGVPRTEVGKSTLVNRICDIADVIGGITHDEVPWWWKACIKTVGLMITH